MKNFIKNVRYALDLSFVIVMLILIFVVPVIWIAFNAITNISEEIDTNRKISYYKEIIDEVDPQKDLELIQGYIYGILDELPDDDAAALEDAYCNISNYCECAETYLSLSEGYDYRRHK